MGLPRLRERRMFVIQYDELKEGEVSDG
jgi:hypothetical protein